jgi:hypothetical protein
MYFEQLPNYESYLRRISGMIESFCAAWLTWRPCRTPFSHVSQDSVKPSRGVRADEASLAAPRRKPSIARIPGDCDLSCTAIDSLGDSKTFRREGH